MYLIFSTFCFVSFSIISYLPFASALKCYNCKSNETCAKEETMCEGGEDTSCVKIEFFVEGNVITERSCHEHNGGELSGCYSLEKKDYEIYTCYCHDKSYCNYANVLTVPSCKHIVLALCFIFVLRSY